MSGFVVMHREAADHPLFAGDTARLGAWAWLIMNACWKPARIRIKGTIVELQRGELSFSTRYLAEAWGWSKSRVDRFLSDLRDEGMISTRSKIGALSGTTAGQGQSIITICNYAKYQDVPEASRDNSGTTSGTTAGQQRDKEEQRNKETILEGREGGAGVHAREACEKPSEASPESAPEITGPDALSLAQDCARAGGVRLIDPGHFGPAVETIREWLKAGADPPLMLATIGRVVSTTKQERIGSLKFFDGAIRRAVAQQEAERNGIQPTRNGIGREPTFSELAMAAANRIRSQGGADLGGGGDTIAGRLGFAGG